VKPFEVQALETIEYSGMTFKLGEGIGGGPPSGVTVVESDCPNVGRDTTTRGVYFRMPSQEVAEGGDCDGFQDVPLTVAGPRSCSERAGFEIPHSCVLLPTGNQIDDLVHKFPRQYWYHRALVEFLGELKEPSGRGWPLYNVVHGRDDIQATPVRMPKAQACNATDCKHTGGGQ